MDAFHNLLNWGRALRCGMWLTSELYLKGLIMAKRFNKRGLSKHRSYTLEEAALIIGAAKQTLSYWGVNCGLEIMKSCKPYMVHGAVLIAFLEAREPKKRPRLKPGEFDCWSCKTRGLPYGGMADYTPMTVKTGRLSALCGWCEGNVGLFVGRVQLQQYADVLEIPDSVN